MSTTLLAFDILGTRGRPPPTRELLIDVPARSAQRHPGAPRFPEPHTAPQSGMALEIRGVSEAAVTRADSRCDTARSFQFDVWIRNPTRTSLATRLTAP